MLPAGAVVHPAHIMSQGVDPSSNGQPFGMLPRGGDDPRHTITTDSMGAVGTMPYVAGAGDSMMISPLDSACQDDFLRDVPMNGDVPSPFLIDDSDPTIGVGGGVPEPVYMANDSMLEDQHRHVKLEMDVEPGIHQMRNPSSFQHFQQINVGPQLLQGQYSLPTKLYSEADEHPDLHAKRICMQDVSPGGAGLGRHPFAGYQIVRTGSEQLSSWAMHPAITQPVGIGKDIMQSPTCITRKPNPPSYMYMNQHGIMSPVTRRHSTGSAHPVNMPSSTPSPAGSMMFPVEENSVPAPVPVMGPGGSFRVNSAPVPYDGLHNVSHMEHSCLGSSTPLGKDQAYRDQICRDDSRVRRRLHKKRENLPKESTALLKNWLLSHMMLPYPGNEEKLALCKATNLDMSQINNWFINARVRIWKPLVREVFDKYSDRLLEQAQKDNDEHQAKRIQDAHKATTMNMITLLSGLQAARKELDELANKSRSLVKEV